MSTASPSPSPSRSSSPSPGRIDPIDALRDDLDRLAAHGDERHAEAMMQRQSLHDAQRGLAAAVLQLDDRVARMTNKRGRGRLDSRDIAVGVFMGLMAFSLAPAILLVALVLARVLTP